MRGKETDASSVAALRDGARSMMQPLPLASEGSSTHLGASKSQGRTHELHQDEWHVEWGRTRVDDVLMVKDTLVSHKIQLFLRSGLHACEPVWCNRGFISAVWGGEK